MAAAALNVSDIFEKAWKLTKEHFTFLILYQLLLYAIAGMFMAGLFGAYKIILIYIALALLAAIAKIGLFRSCLLIADGITPGYEQFYSNWRVLGWWVLAWILFEAVFLAGWSFFVIPGLFVLCRFGLFPFFIVDKGAGPIEAFKQAYEASSGYWLELLWLFLAVILLNLAGLLLFGIGLLVTFPVTCIAVALAYRQLTSDAQSELIDV